MLEDELALEDELLDEELPDEDVSPPQPLTTARQAINTNANGILGLFTVAAPMTGLGSGFHHKEVSDVANEYGKSASVGKKKGRITGPNA